MQLRPTACRAGRAMVSLVQNVATGLVSSVLESPANQSLLLATVSHSTRGQVAVVRCPAGAWLWHDIPGGPQIIVETRN